MALPFTPLSDPTVGDMNIHARWETSAHRCPVCDQWLIKVARTGMINLWCGYGPCLSYAANDGAWAPTEAEAFDRLKHACDSEWDARKEA